MEVLTQIVRAAGGGRARSGPAPSPERLRELARQVAAGSYRVPPDRVAEALLRALGPPARRG